MTTPVPFGKFLLLDRLNVGGMAEVFLAKVFGRGGEGRVVAIKRILPALLADPEFVGMFIDEARIAVQLDHRNLVQIFELGRQADNFYIAMEYVSGCDLRMVIDRSKKRKQPLSIGQSIHVICEVAAGLDHAHRARDREGRSLEIVHRDVSPQNIVLSRDGSIRLIDFGIAKAATRQQATQAGILKGKFGYMSPEQARGQPIDRRSDIFATGIILYELLTGVRLFGGEADFAVLEKVRKAEIPAPRQANPAIPQPLERIVLKALARDPDRRYAWASDLIGDLRSLEGFEKPGGGAESLASWLRSVLAEELSREEERLRAFEAIPRPPELPEVPLETFMVARAAPGTGENPTVVLPERGLAHQFEQVRTRLLSNPAEGLFSAPSETDVGDRWEASTRSPLPVQDWRPDPAPVRAESSTSGEAIPPRAANRRRLPWIALALLLIGAVAAAGVWSERRFSSTGTLVVTAHPSADLQVEVDNQPVTLSKEGIGVLRKLPAGSHFMLAKGPAEHQARWVTVVPDQVTTVDLVFPSPPPDPSGPPLAHNQQ